tara:strand:+ start:123 stop:422 length:300 start_codon:yes stop_codon:yes gene_type:complete
MSHEFETRDLPITYIETDYDYDSNYSYDKYNGFLYIEPIPEFFTQEFKGLHYGGIDYSWDEIEYRMGVDYPSVPEPSSAGLFIGLIATTIIIYKKFKKS